MKKSKIDFFKKAKYSYLQERSFISKFVRYWGTTWYNGVEYLMPYNNYYTSNGYPWSKYTSVLSDACTNVDPNGRSGFAPECSRERKLLDFLKVYDKVSAQNMDGVESAWLLLNPAKNSAETIIEFAQLNNYINTHKDAQGRLTFKIRLLANSSFIPGVGFQETNVNVNTLNIPDYSSYNTIIENTIQVDQLGNPILDSSGHTIPSTESVRSYDSAKNYIRANTASIWKNNLVIPDGTDIYGNPLTTNNNIPTHSTEGTLKSLLSRYALFFMSTNLVRIEYIQKGIIPYTIYKTSTDVINDTGDFIGPLDPNYSNFNSNTSNNGDFYNWSITYNIPTYDITFVLKNPSSISSTDPLGIQLTADIEADYYKVNPDLEFAYITRGISSWETNKEYFHIYGRVNGFLTKNIVTLEQSSSSPWGLHFSEKTFPDPLNMWTYLPIDSGYWILRKDALTTNTYIPLKKDRIAYIQALLDTKYHQKSAGWLSILIMIVAIIIAVVIAVLSYYTLSGYSYALLMAVATGITTFSLLLSLGSMLAQAMGSYADAMWISQFNKSISPLVMVSSIFLAVQSLWTIAQNFAQSASTIAGQSLVQTARQFVEKIFEWVKQKIMSLGIQDAFKILGKAMDMWEKNSLTKLQGSVQAKQEELQKYQEAAEQNKYGDMWKNFAQMLLNPLTLLGSSYEFDRPYEPVYGQIHSGNSCRTTVLGLYGSGAEMYVSNIK